MKTLKNTVAALILVAFTGTSLFAQQAKPKADEKKATTSKKDDKKGDKKKDIAVKGEGVPSKSKASAPAKPGTSTSVTK